VSARSIAVSVPAPLYRSLDYTVPAALPLPAIGSRVRVPLGRRSVVGVVVGHGEAGVAGGLRALDAVLDAEPLLTPELLSLLRWAASYYQHPLGEALVTALPPALRRGEPLPAAPPHWALTPAGETARATLPARRSAQRALLEAVAAGASPAGGAALRRARAEGWLRDDPRAPALRIGAGPALTADQQAVLAALDDRPGVHLVHGVTGSGKTEVYLQAAAARLAAGAQVLVLVPEIGLTPQSLARFRARFGEAVGEAHSGMAEGARLRVWEGARSGRLRVVVGTRSAVWLPFARLGLIVVDEEHDPSFKQQDGFRYSARDVACYRGARLGIPVLLGSATPALESLHNARSGRYRHLRLDARVQAQAPPTVNCVDLRGQPLDEGLSPSLLQAVERCLADDGQALLFLNRRGFAPLLMCHACGWRAPCPACDAHLTLHRAPTRLACHHCGYQMPVAASCPSCESTSLIPVGQGTERIEQALARRFPGERVERFDTDRTRSPRQLAALLDDIHAGRVRLLVGTQLLAKGHDFPRLNLVGIVSADQALFGADFRAIERMGQLITQVAGRAGRSGQAARVLLQTHVPEHPLLQRLLREGYESLADALLEERRVTGLPPYGHLALLRAEAPAREDALAFLAAAAERLAPDAAVTVLPPTVAGMERRAGRSRAQLLLMSAQRPRLHAVLQPWVLQLPALQLARRVRWAIDVDPYDLF
jgi:primosomal protein N' (replication factor Y) (superfamily II helicase)